MGGRSMGRTFSFLCIAVIIGMMIGYFFNIKIDVYFLIPLLLLMIFITMFYEKYTLICLTLSFVFLGNYIFGIHMKDTTILREYPLEDLGLEVEIMKIGIDQGKYVEYDVKILKLIEGNENIIINEKARLQINYGKNIPLPLEPFDIISIKNATLIESFNNKDLDNYQLYLRGKGIKAVLQVNVRDIIQVAKYNHINLINSSYKTRKYIEDYFDTSLSVIEGGMLKSIIFGNQGYLDKKLLDLFSISGTAHIIAVSGLHVGILVLILHYLLKLLQVGKKYILLITMILLLFYSAIVNFPVSIIRAMSMYYLYVLGYFLERKYDAINSLCMIAFLLLLFNPFNLFSISFQLSFAATLSILLFYPYVLKGLKFVPNYLQSILAVTIAAQLGTIPIMIYHFQQLSLIALVANILIVPILAPLLFMAFASIISGLISSGLSAGINKLIHYILLYMHWIVRKLSDVPFAAIKIENFSWQFILLYYFLLFALYLTLWHNKMRLNSGEALASTEL